MIAMLPPTAPAALDRTGPEICRDAPELGTCGEQKFLYPDLVRLINGDFDEPEALMASLQEKVRQGDLRLARGLEIAARGERFEPDLRALALETLAGARLRVIDDLVREAIREAMTSTASQLQFAGVAAASDLSRKSQVLLSGLIRELAADEAADPAVRRAASAFLKRRAVTGD